MPSNAVPAKDVILDWLMACVELPESIQDFTLIQNTDRYFLLFGGVFIF